MINPDLTVDQADGSRWSVFYDQHHPEGFTVLTSSGNELMSNHEESSMRSLIHQYRAAEVGSIALLGHDKSMRRELGKGQEATVYAMGSFAVREVKGIASFYSALGELQRMDAINNVIEHGLPRWLMLPKHYALHVDPKLQKTYTLMDRIDGGITVEDIIEYPNIPANRVTTVEAELGDNIGHAKEMVPALYDEAFDVLCSALTKSGRNPANYLTDWKPRNAIIDGRLGTPVAGSEYNLAVIDQYRA